ncbi:prenyltransferase [Enterococcus sp. LJL51]|uniref:prenyltransferase n=1 Tax=Enterococcus sp. LJL51 TaxID=3416656 RepID=UPI003CFB7AAF
MLSRLNTYYKEMFPLIPRLFVGVIMFFEIYFLLLLNYGVKVEQLAIGMGEIVGSLTIFIFLMILRIADDFKDYETDQRLFPHRALPSGRVYKQDLIKVAVVVIVIAVVSNIIWMNNLPFFAFLFIYGTLMSLWFFQKSKIQPNLLLALVTHNPVQLVMNAYIISFTCYKYDLPLVSWTSFLVLLTLYFPALIWEISRKIRAPKDETEYVTYSRIFGYKKATRFVLILTAVDVVTNILLTYRLNRFAVLLILGNLLWFTLQCRKFSADPTQFKIVDKVERYTYILETMMILVVIGYLLLGRL